MTTILKKSMLVALTSITLFSPSAFAADLFWGVAGTWNTGAPWFSDAARTKAVAWTAGDIAHFDQVSTIILPTANMTIGGIVANENVTFTAGSVIGTGALNASSPVSFSVASGKLLDLGTQGLVANAGTNHGIIKDGAGTLAIAGNGYLGGFTLNSGTVTTKAAGAFGNGVLTINGGAIGAAGNYAFGATGVNIGADFTIGGVTSGGGIATAAFSFAATAPVSLGSATRTITMGGTGLVTFNGNMSGDANVGLTLNSTLTTGSVLSSLRLMGDNSGYQGLTTIGNYAMLKLGSVTALGSTAAGTVVNGGTLDINGINYTAAEPVTLNGGSGFAAISNNSAIEATFNGPITITTGSSINGAAGKLNLTNNIDGIGRLSLAGVQGGSVSGVVSVHGGLQIVNGTWTISGANTYTDSTKIIPAKTLILGAAGVIPDNSPLSLGGILKTGATVGFSEALGTLTVYDNSTIALGTGAHTLTFAKSAAAVWTAAKTVTITGWTGSVGQSGTAGKIMVGTDANALTPAQLAQINFAGFGTGAALLSTGELVPSTLAGINDIDLSSVTVSLLKDGNLNIIGLQEKVLVSIYNGNGMLISSKLMDSSDNTIVLNQKGFYIVKVGSKTFKVIR